MKQCAHFSFYEPNQHGFSIGSRYCDRLPLMVNYAGFHDSPIPIDTHHKVGREDVYLLYVVSGKLNVFMPTGEVLALPGDLVFFPPHYPYHYTYDGRGEPLQYFCVHFTGSHAERLPQELGFSPMPCLHTVGSNPHFSLLFSHLFELFPCTTPMREQELGCMLWQILLAFGGALAKEQRVSLPLERSLRQIHTHYTEELSIPELARGEHLSSSRFHALFQAQTGTSPVRYIARLRIQHACRLLRSTSLTVAQVGSMVGYHDPHFFSKVFKNQIGLSPKQYREGKDEI